MGPLSGERQGCDQLALLALKILTGTFSATSGSVGPSGRQVKTDSQKKCESRRLMGVAILLNRTGEES